MEDYLSIGDVSRLSGVGIKALRYYEKVGVLIPAYINPENKYRYYRHEQLTQLDMIQLCVELGVPLSNMKHYILPDGTFQAGELFQLCLSLSQEKVRQLNRKVSHLLYGLNLMEMQTGAPPFGEIYTRRIPRRQVFAIRREDEQQTYAVIWEQINVLAAKEHVDITYPSGSVKTCENGKITEYLFMEAHNADTQNPHIRYIAGSDYRCCQTYDESGSEMPSLFGLKDSSNYQMVVSSVMTPLINYSHSVYEIQLPLYSTNGIFAEEQD